MSRRAQISLFLILALVLVLGVVLYQYVGSRLPGSEASAQRTFEDRVLAVKTATQACVDKTAEDALVLFGLQGGYIFPQLNLLEGVEGVPPQTIPFGEYDVNLLQYQDFNLMPSKDFFEQYQLAEYMRLELPKCVLFSEFRDLNITTDPVNVSASIGDKVTFSVKYPMTIRLGARQSYVDAFTTEQDINLEGMLSQASDLINAGKLNLGYFDATLIADSPYNITVSLTEDETTFLYAITDKDSPIQGRPYVFVFGARFAP